MVGVALFVVLLSLVSVKGAAVVLSENIMNDLYSYDMDLFATEKLSKTIPNIIPEDENEVVDEEFNELIEDPSEDDEEMDARLLNALQRFETDDTFRFSNYGSTFLITCVFLMPILSLVFGIIMLIKERLDEPVAIKTKKGNITQVGSKYETI